LGGRVESVELILEFVLESIVEPWAELMALVPVVPEPSKVLNCALALVSSEPPWLLFWEAQPTANKPARAINAINLLIVFLVSF